ncbi:MAG: DUF4832 domain-containing protein [Muribaculaceae bacterium]|nr:DUF4832 domain-containing protein [Muribaculaceae bacterium]
MTLKDLKLFTIASAMTLALQVQAKAPAVVATFEPDSVTVLRNPFTGWVMYLGRNWDENFWEKEGYDRMEALGEDAPVRVSDYANTAYIRTSWVTFEPEEGKYVWNDPDSRFMRLLKSVRDRGMRMALRVVIDGRDQGQNTPQYVFDAGAEWYYDPKAPGKNKSPYPDDPVFQEKYAKFLHAFAEYFDDPDMVEFIDGFSIGKWGESHSIIYKDPANKQQVAHWLINLATDCFRKVPPVIFYHRMLADADDDGWGPVPDDAEELITEAVDLGWSLRHDAFGMTGYYQDWEKAMARRWNFHRPIIMEGGWITAAHHRYWRDPSGRYREGHSEDVRQGEYEAAAEARVNMMDLRINDETRSWFRQAFPLVRKFVAEGGYRLYPDMVTVPTEVKRGRRSAVTSRWNNMGWGYCPVNIPQWNQKYKVGIALIDSDDQVVTLHVDRNTDLSKWIKGSQSTYRTELEIGRDVKPGRYRWAVGLVDTTKGNSIGLYMAVDPSMTVGGWLPVAEVNVK